MFFDLSGSGSRRECRAPVDASRLPRHVKFQSGTPDVCVDTSYYTKLGALIYMPPRRALCSVFEPYRFKWDKQVLLGGRGVL